MNIESKYLIRWAIPGWVYVMFFLITYYIFYKDSISLFADAKNSLTDLVGLALSGGIIGLILGYLFHQTYFSFNWIFRYEMKNKFIIRFFLRHPLINEIISTIGDHKYTSSFIVKEKEDKRKVDLHRTYYKLEFLWHKELLRLDEEKRNYIAERYRHLLNTTHALGALWVSVALSSLTLVIFAFINIKILFSFQIEFFYLFILIACLVYLWIAIHRGYYYYYTNLNSFQGHVFREMVKEKEPFKSI